MQLSVLRQCCMPCQHLGHMAHELAQELKAMGAGADQQIVAERAVAW